MNYVIFLILLPLVFCASSKRGKCALECYSRCMLSGTPSAVHCNCVVNKKEQICDSIDQKLTKASIIGTAPMVSSEYVDSHSIQLQLPAHPAAFAYIFEYSTISTDPDDWYFAGASINPSVTFTILDPCRDYQFRVITVIRSTDPDDLFVIYRPRPIPVELPPFILDAEKIVVEAPTLNATTDLIKLYVKWKLPVGYSDSDIYGYEAPALYPMQCRTPEQDLPQPRIEIVRGGGRLAVTLPSVILEARCRLWVEVKMLPRCIRLEPFSIQKSIEIDCNKRPEMDVCKKDENPMCTDIIDIWGASGEAKIAWESPNGVKPLYYHLRYGPAEKKGVAPFITWQLKSKKNVKVESGVKSVTLNIPEKQNYGVQVCAILTQQRKHPKFGVIKVTPFRCEACKMKGSCSDHCNKIEGEDVHNESWNITKNLIPENKKLGEDGGKEPSSSQTVLRMETDLIVAAGTLQAPTNISTSKNSPPEPISLDRAGEINNSAQPGEESKKETPTPEQTLEDVKDTLHSSAHPVEAILEPKTDDETSVISGTSNDTMEDLKTEISGDKSLETIENVTEKADKSTLSEDNEESQPKVEEEPAKDESDERETEIETDEPDEKREDIGVEKDSDQSSERIPLPEELEKSLRSLETAMELRGEDPESFLPDFPMDAEANEDMTLENVSLSERSNADARSDAADEQQQQQKQQKPNVLTLTAYNPTEITSKSSEAKAHGIKLHVLDDEKEPAPSEKWKKCLLKSGIVCEFGCETRITCLCPLKTHVLLSSGGCVLKDRISSSCLRKSDVNATWDPITMNILVHSPAASNHIRSMASADRLFVEFGRVRNEHILMRKGNRTLGGFVFDQKITHKMVMGTEKIIETGIFSLEPFMFHVNESVDIQHFVYGMRICTFNSQVITDPYKYSWDSDGIEDGTPNIVQVTQLSPIYFTNDLRRDNISDSYWRAFFNIGKFTLLVVLVIIMFLLVYINCSRIKSLYDRKRTRYFRPYYLEPQVHVTPASRQPGLHRTDHVSNYETQARMI